MTDDKEQEEVEQRTAPTSAVVHRAICTEGESELERPSAALMWSGLAAGLSMGFSFITPALLHSLTPAAKWQPLVTSLGYPVGFMIVVLGRQQLFTENTLTVVLPFLVKPRLSTLGNIARVWVIALAANAIGAIAVAYVLANTDAVSNEAFQSMSVLAHHVYEPPFATTVLRGIFAGWLIALMVWLLPFAETGRILVIALLTYVVGLAHFSHIIAGTVDAAFLVFAGQNSWMEMLTRFFVPALLGNIIGGVLLVAVVNHGQVKAGEDAQDA